MIVEAFPEWRQTTFDHELAHDGLVKVFGANVCSQRNEEATVDTFLLHTLLALILSYHTLLFTLACLSLLFRLATWLLGAGLVSSTAGAEMEEREVLSAGASTTDIVHGVLGGTG